MGRGIMEMVKARGNHSTVATAEPKRKKTMPQSTTTKLMPWIE